MGNMCSSDKDGVRHEMQIKRNLNNKNNPTENYSNWKDKLLVEATNTDPSQVVRDFPRMITYVKVNAERHNLPKNIVSKTTNLSDDANGAADGNTSKANAGGHGGKKGQMDKRQNSGSQGKKNSNNPLNNEAYDDFVERNRRVKETVLLLCDMCNETGIFGIAFAEAWDRRERDHASGNGQKVTGGASATTGSGVVMDVHQLLQLCCIESGMIVPPGGLSVANTSIFEGDDGNGGTMRFSRSSRQHSLNLGDNSAAPSKGGKNNGGMPNNSKIATPASPLLAACADTAAMALQAHNGSVRNFIVHSGAFHLMMYAVQSLVYTPSQRLKHVMWVPWTTNHYEDSSWVVHITEETVTPETFYRMKRRQDKNRNASEYPATPAAGVNNDSMVNSRRDSYADDDSRGSLIPDNTNLFENDTNNGHKVNSLLNREHTQSNGDGNRKQKELKKIIVIRHVLDTRHYVEKADEKNIPKYEMTWECAIRIDKEEMMSNFRGKTSSFELGGGGGAGGDNASANSLNHAGSSNNYNGSGALIDFTPNVDNLPSHNNTSTMFENNSKLSREVMQMTLNVQSCRLLKRKQISYTSKWKENKDELAFILEEQYKVPLEEVSEFKEKS